MTPIVAAEAVIIVILLALVAAYATGAIKGPTSSSANDDGVTPAGAACNLPGATPIVGTGSTLVAPLMYTWEASYRGGTEVNYNSLGSTAGITAITGKTVDFGASDAPLNFAQRTANPGQTFLTVPESAGAVVPLYNVQGTGITHLDFNGSLLAQIFMGTVTNWNNTELQALNPTAHLPNQPITVVHRTGGSGTTFIFTSFLSDSNAVWAKTYGKGTSWPTNISTGTGQSGNAGVTAYVVESAYSIGYVDLNYALTGGATVSYGAVENPAGHFIVANVSNSASALADAQVTLPAGAGDWYNVSFLNAPGAGDYPVTSLTYLLVYQNLSLYPSYTLSNAENLVDFLNWVITKGQVYSNPLSYVPLPAAVVAEDNTTLNTITYNGNAVPVCISNA